MSSNRKKVIVFTPNKNYRKKDYEYAFKPESEALCNFLMDKYEKENTYVDIDVTRVDISRSKTGCLLEMVETIAKVFWMYMADIDIIYFLCHGYQWGIQLGLNRRNIEEFIDVVHEYLSPDIKFIFYCCNVAKNRGLCEYLTKVLIKKDFRDFRVVGHNTRGHTTKNPYVKVFDKAHPKGYYIIPPKSVTFKKWRKLLKTDFRFEYPLLDIEEIRKRIQ